MNITYQRNLHKSYMCIETTKDIVQSHELILLQKYKVPQLLDMQIVIQDGKTQYWFEVTGKQQLADYLGGKPIGMEMLRTILFSLEQVCEKMPEFLLKEDRLSLQKELIYVDLADKTVHFTYLPFEDGCFPEKFQAWMAETLKEIDHQEQTCVELAYQVYEASINENISIHQVLREVMKNNVLKPEIPIFETVEKEKKAEFLQRDLQEEQVLSQKKRIGTFLADAIAEKKEEIQWEIKEYFQSRVPSSIRNYLKSDESQKAKESTILSRLSRKKSGEKEKKTQKKKQKKKKTSKEMPIETYHTQKLYKNKNQPEGKLVYQGENQCEDIWIQGVEFFIGRNSGQADANIKTESISRLHAKILKKEGEYYIEDLNSTNGTYLNGEKLEYHKSKKLNKNDRIQFGAEAYVFY